MRLLMHTKRGAAKKSRMGPVTSAFQRLMILFAVTCSTASGVLKSCIRYHTIKADSWESKASMMHKLPALNRASFALRAETSNV